jgi:rod shape-determining protein MreC
MRFYPYKKYLLVGAALFLLLSLPMPFVQKIRGSAMGIFSFVFKGANLLVKGQVDAERRLEAENHLLRIEIGKLRALLEQKTKVEQLEEELHHLTLSPKHYEETQFLTQLSHQAIPARVIYRDPGSWSSSFWVNVGEETNKLLERCVVQKNSPVVLGRAVVGVVDYVGKRQSRVCLITDGALKPSVRAVRGFPQNMALIEHIDPLLRHLNGESDFPLKGEERALLIKKLGSWKEQLSIDVEGWYLAKGILQGKGTPHWRSLNHTLRGIGFNYDFPDEEGGARELQTGKPIDEEDAAPALPIIKVSDLLVTTGMDGLFPPGLRVGEVTKILPLKEGGYAYEIEALPVVGNLDTLHTVFIIPPVGFEQHESCKS